MHPRGSFGIGRQAWLVAGPGPAVLGLCPHLPSNSWLPSPQARVEASGPGPVCPRALLWNLELGIGLGQGATHTGPVLGREQEGAVAPLWAPLLSPPGLRLRCRRQGLDGWGGTAGEDREAGGWRGGQTPGGRGCQPRSGADGCGSSECRSSRRGWSGKGPVPPAESWCR